MTSFNSGEPMTTPAEVLDACRLGRIRSGQVVTVALSHPELQADETVKRLTQELGWYGVQLERVDGAGEEFRVETSSELRR